MSERKVEMNFKRSKKKIKNNNNNNKIQPKSLFH